MSSWIKRAVAFPLLHFFVAGAVIYSFVPEERPVIVVSDPSQVDEEILIHEASKLGLLDDPVVSKRLAQIGRFVADHPCESAAEAKALARDLDLDREDLVIRRYLAEMMRLAIAAESDRTLPTEAQLEAHLREHADRFRDPEKLALVQVFVSARRGTEMGARADALRDQLVGHPPANVMKLGDPFTRPSEITASLPEIGQIFGPKFAEGLDADALQFWQGPIPSAHGVHWVWIERRLPARLPDVSEIRGQLVHHHRRVKRQEHLRRRLAGLRTRYQIVTEANEG